MFNLILRYLGVGGLMVASALLYSKPDDLKGWTVLIGGLSAFIKSEAELHGYDQRLEVDRALFREFLEEMPTYGAVGQFYEHDFGASFSSETLSRLQGMGRHWAMPEREFLDRAVEKLKARLVELIEDFGDSAAEYTFHEERHPEFQRVPSKWSYEDADLYQHATEELKNLATDIYQTHQKLIRTARHRLHV